jgi:hypothetical protein
MPEPGGDRSKLRPHEFRENCMLKSLTFGGQRQNDSSRMVNVPAADYARDRILGVPRTPAAEAATKSIDTPSSPKLCRIPLWAHAFRLGVKVAPRVAIGRAAAALR